jgi:hypothetical protein
VTRDALPSSRDEINQPTAIIMPMPTAAPQIGQSWRVMAHELILDMRAPD